MESSAKAKGQNRLQELDVFRGIAALAVLLFHYSYRYFEIYDKNVDSYVIFKYGYLGVHFFFMISGFVIFLTLSKTKNVDLFLRKRFIRLYPTYWISLTITFLVVYIVGLEGKENTIKEALIGLTMFQEVLSVKHIDGVYWSLTIELFFYLLVSLLTLFKILNNTKVWGFIWLGVILVFHFMDIRIPAFYLNLEYGMLFLGGIMFYEIYTRKNSSLLMTYVLLFSSLLTFYITNPSNGARIIVTGFYSLFFLFSINKLRWIKNKVFIFLGTISYALYLIHQEIGYLILKNTTAISSPLLRILIATTLTISLATIITFYFEKPLSAFLRNRILRIENPTHNRS